MDVEETVEMEVTEEQESELVPAGTEAETPTETPDSEAAIAAEMLDATQEEEKAKIEVPLPKYVALKHQDRANRQIIEVLQSQLAERQKAETPPVEKSPAEKFIEDGAETFDPQTDPLPAAVQLAQGKWEKAQAKKDAEIQEAKKRSDIGSQSLAKAQTSLSDFEDVVGIGQSYLTPGDKLDIQMSADPAMELYKRCMDRTLRSKSPDAAVLRQALKAKLTPKTSVPPKTKEETKSEVGTETIPEATGPMDKRLAHLYAALGM